MTIYGNIGNINLLFLVFSLSHLNFIMFSRLFRKKTKTIKETTQPQALPSPFPLTWITSKDMLFGSFALSQAPGKKIEKGRNGKKFDRNLAEDVKFIKGNYLISTIVCLLNKFELRTIGINLEDYKKYCEDNKINLVVYPIVEMGVPEEDFESFHNGIIKIIVEELSLNHNVLIHCRGGIGRAGTIACCLLLFLGMKDSVNDAVKFLRSVRDKRCVESRKQYDFIKGYMEFYQGNYYSKK